MGSLNRVLNIKEMDCLSDKSLDEVVRYRISEFIEITCRNFNLSESIRDLKRIFVRAGEFKDVYLIRYLIMLGLKILIKSVIIDDTIAASIEINVKFLGILTLRKIKKKSVCCKADDRKICKISQVCNFNDICNTCCGDMSYRRCDNDDKLKKKLTVRGSN